MAFDSTTSIMKITINMTDNADKKTNKSFNNIDPTKLDDPTTYAQDAASFVNAYVSLTNAVSKKAFNDQRNDIQLS